MNLIERAYAIVAPDIAPSETQVSSIKDLLIKIANFVIGLAGIVAVIYLVYSGILYITAAGNAENAKKGQQGLVNAIIGIIVIALALVIVRAVGGSGNFINF